MVACVCVRDARQKGIGDFKEICIARIYMLLVFIYQKNENAYLLLYIVDERACKYSIKKFNVYFSADAEMIQ